MEFADPKRVGLLLAGLTRPWYVCGGWALDLFLQRVTRQHKDVDVAMARSDQATVQHYLRQRGWRLEKAVKGNLAPWEDGERLTLPVHGVWCRHDHYKPDFIELLFNEIDETHFRYRRDQSIEMKRDRMWFRTEQGLPVLAPEIVLLYKSTAAEENEADFQATVGYLSKERREWLRESLRRTSGQHRWIEYLS
jgi:hypothetical protein